VLQSPVTPSEIQEQWRILPRSSSRFLHASTLARLLALLPLLLRALFFSLKEEKEKIRLLKLRSVVMDVTFMREATQSMNEEVSHP
jgi:hypothetical protein